MCIRDSMYWWEWAVRYNGETHWGSEFDVLRYRARSRTAYWIMSNGEVMVRIRAMAKEPNRIYIRYYIRPLERGLGDIIFYQGADFDIDDTLTGDQAFYEKGVTYALGEDGTYIGFRFLRNRHPVWHLDYYEDMWDAIDEGQFNNAIYSNCLLYTSPSPRD